MIDLGIWSVKEPKKHQRYKQYIAIYSDIFSPKDDKYCEFFIIENSIFHEIKTTAKGNNWANH